MYLPCLSNLPGYKWPFSWLDIDQSILPVFHQLQRRHVATKLRCAPMTSVPSLILALSLHIKAVKALHNRVNERVCTKPDLLFLARATVTVCDHRQRPRVGQREKDEVRRPLKPCNNCGFMLWAWQAAQRPGPVPS